MQWAKHYKENYTLGKTLQRKLCNGQNTTKKTVLLCFTDSDYVFGIFRLLAIVLFVLLCFTYSDYVFGIFRLLAIVLSVPSLLYRFCALIYKRYIRI
jgi:hypothetical protein